MRIFSALDFARAAERVELSVEAVGLAAEDRGDLALILGAEVLAGVRDLFCGVEHRAVVDPHGVRVLVLDDGAVHERPEVSERLVVQDSTRDPLRDRVGELRRDLVHVGEAVGHRHRDLLASRALGDTGANRIGERELAAEVVRALGRDPEVGAHRDDPIRLPQPGARVPAADQIRGQVVRQPHEGRVASLGQRTASFLACRRPPRSHRLIASSGSRTSAGSSPSSIRRLLSHANAVLPALPSPSTPATCARICVSGRVASPVAAPTSR